MPDIEAAVRAKLRDIAYRFFSEDHVKKLNSLNNSLTVSARIACGFMAIITGGSLVYVIFHAICPDFLVWPTLQKPS